MTERMYETTLKRIAQQIERQIIACWWENGMSDEKILEMKRNGIYGRVFAGLMHRKLDELGIGE
jgi:hypothetical protein